MKKILALVFLISLISVNAYARTIYVLKIGIGTASPTRLCISANVVATCAP